MTDLGTLGALAAMPGHQRLRPGGRSLFPANGRSVFVGESGVMYDLNTPDSSQLRLGPLKRTTSMTMVRSSGRAPITAGPAVSWSPIPIGSSATAASIIDLGTLGGNYTMRSGSTMPARLSVNRRMPWAPITPSSGNPGVMKDLGTSGRHSTPRQGHQRLRTVWLARA